MTQDAAPGRVVLTAALTLAIAPPAAAFAVVDLMRALAEVSTARATFVETRHSALLKEPLVTRGRLVYRRPDRLERHITAPFEQSITIEGSRVTLSGKEGSVPRSVALPAGPAQALIESLRATLAGDLAALERHFAVSVAGTPDAWTLTLLPRDPALGALLSRVDISGRGARVQRIESTEANGDRAVTVIGDEPR